MSPELVRGTALGLFIPLLGFIGLYLVSTSNSHQWVNFYPVVISWLFFLTNNTTLGQWALRYTLGIIMYSCRILSSYTEKDVLAHLQLVIITNMIALVLIIFYLMIKKPLSSKTPWIIGWVFPILMVALSRNSLVSPTDLFEFLVAYYLFIEFIAAQFVADLIIYLILRMTR